MWKKNPRKKNKQRKTININEGNNNVNVSYVKYI